MGCLTPLGLRCTCTGRGSVYVHPTGPPWRSAPHGGNAVSPVSPGSRPVCPLPLGDRSPSKKHSGARPLRESPHGKKNSVRGTWSRDRDSAVFLRLLLLLWVPAASSLSPWGTVSWGGPSRPRSREVTRGWRRQDWIRRGEDTGAKWGAQVTLPASSRSLQPSADTQPQAGGGVRGRDGTGREGRGKAAAVVVFRDQRWWGAGPAPGVSGRGSDAPR